MKYTQEHYEELVARREAGEASDEDNRFLKMYERPKPSGGSVRDTAVYDAATAERAPERVAKVRPAAPDEVDEPFDYSGLTREQLRALAVERGLDVKGKQVGQVVELLQEYDAEQNKKD